MNPPANRSSLCGLQPLRGCSLVTRCELCLTPTRHRRSHLPSSASPPPVTAQVPTQQAPQSDGVTEDKKRSSTIHHQEHTFLRRCCWHQQLKMAPCLPDTVTAQMSLLWGLGGGTQETPAWASQRRQLGARETASGPPTWPGTALPGFLPARGLSPALLSAGDWTACLCHPRPRPASVLLSLFLSRHSSLQLPKSAALPAGHQPARASFRQPTAAGLPSAEPAVSTRSSHLTPARRILRAVRSPQNNDSASRAATSANHHCSTLAPREGKTESMQPPGEPFLLHCRV